MGTIRHKTARFFKAVADEVAAKGTVSQQIAALVFDHDADRVRVLLRNEEHEPDYPDLDTILSLVAYDCQAEKIEVQHLRQINFLPHAVNLECVNGKEQPLLYTWAIEARLH